MGKADPIAFVAWSSLAAPLPLLALSLWRENGRTLPALLHPTWALVASVTMLAYGGAMLGFGLWSRLTMLYPAAVVAPFALWIPIVGMVAGRLIFAEPLSAIEYAGALLVMAGLCFNVLGDRMLAPRRARTG